MLCCEKSGGIALNALLFDGSSTRELGTDLLDYPDGSHLEILRCRVEHVGAAWNCTAVNIQPTCFSQRALVRKWL